MGPAVSGKIQGPHQTVGCKICTPWASEGRDTAVSEQKGATSDVQGQRERAAWMTPLALEAQVHPG